MDFPRYKPKKEEIPLLFSEGGCIKGEKSKKQPDLRTKSSIILTFKFKLGVYQDTNQFGLPIF